VTDQEERKELLARLDKVNAGPAILAAYEKAPLDELRRCTAMCEEAASDLARLGSHLKAVWHADAKQYAMLAAQKKR
jgi:hypothetical protein